MEASVYSDFDYIIQKIFVKMDEVYDWGHKPVILVVSRDIHYMIMRSEEVFRHHLHVHPHGPLKSITGLKIHVSGMLPDGCFMILNSDELAAMLRYREILQDNISNIEDKNVTFDIAGMNVQMVANKTYLLEGYKEEE